jgi:hypothetical protein
MAIHALHFSFLPVQTAFHIALPGGHSCGGFLGVRQDLCLKKRNPTYYTAFADFSIDYIHKINHLKKIMERNTSLPCLTDF